MTATPEPRRNGLFLVIDGLRFDTMQNDDARRRLFPTLHRLVAAGHLAKVTTNAQATQFVMPALFSQSYPLDYGGYNQGIRARPASYVEALKSAGYATGLFSSCNQLGVGMGYERGFDRLCTAMDYRLLIEHRITRFLGYYLDGLKRGARSESEVLEIIQAELTGLLEQIVRNFETDDKSAWPPKMRRRNLWVARGAASEIELIRDDPKAVLVKLNTVPAGIYWQFLGHRSVGGLSLFAKRAVESVRWRSAKWISRRRFPPVLVLTHIEAVAPEILKPAADFVRRQPRDVPWHMHIHLMDVHDSRAVNRIGNFLARSVYLPRWALGRLRGLTRRHWIYDTALMYVDRKLKPLVDLLEETDQLQRTCIVVTGDHGDRFPLSPRRKKANVAERTYREDIEVPLIAHAPWRTEAADTDGLFDSMSVSATLLDCLDVAPAEAFLGRGLFTGGKPFTVTECAGSGNADVAEKDLYFTVTGRRHKLMARLSGQALEVRRLYDLQTDPSELTDLSDRAESRDTVDELVAALHAERKPIFELRRANPDWRLAAR